MRRFIFPLAVSLLAVVLLAAYFAWPGRRPTAAPPPTPPITVPVTRGAVQQTILAPGQMVGTREVVVAAEHAGPVAVIDVRPGSPVQDGERLLQYAGGEEQTAPIAGVVLEVLVRPGEAVTPGQPLCLLADPAALEVEVTVVEEDLPLVQVGQAAELYFDALPEAGALGHVARIVPRRVPLADRPLYTVYLSLAAPVPGAVAGMTVDASILLAEAGDVLRLPRAVVRAGAGDIAAVKVWTGASVEERQIQVGLRGNVYVEIVSGLQAGEQVVGE